MNDKPHVMIDLETLGTKVATNALSLGICLFDKSGIYRSEEYFFQYDPRRQVSFDTLMWWAKQPGFSTLLEMSKTKGKPHGQICNEIKEILPAKHYIWSNGANFDVPILESMFNQNNIPIPWPYWDVRCYRTLKATFPQIENGLINKSKHDALCDAEFQANAVIKYLKELK